MSVVDVEKGNKCIQKNSYLSNLPRPLSALPSNEGALALCSPLFLTLNGWRKKRQVLEQKALPIEHCPACGRTHRSRHTNRVTRKAVHIAPPLNAAPLEWRLTNDGRATAKTSTGRRGPWRRGRGGGRWRRSARQSSSRCFVARVAYLQAILPLVSTIHKYFQFCICLRFDWFRLLEDFSLRVARRNSNIWIRCSFK